jgi:uncharacterized protein (TIGR02646 family)
MRHILKNESPVAFEVWKKRFEYKHGRKATYKDLHEEQELKSTVKEELILEQFGLCCYCCKEIERGDCHIEHFRPQESFNWKTVDYDNIHVSCNGSKGKGKENSHCGQKKGNWFDERLTVSPLESDCESLFEYNYNGDIIASDEKVRTEETIKQLGLNTYALQTARAAAIRTTGIAESYFDEELRTYWIKYFEEKEEGKLKPFYVSVLHCLTNY